MSEQSRQPKDKNYNLITVLYQSSDNVESLKTYIQDAQSEGDQSSCSSPKWTIFTSTYAQQLSLVG